MFLKKSDDALSRKISYRHIAWLYALSRSLRGQDPTENLDSYLSVEELNQISRHRNIPLAILQKNAHDLAALKNAGRMEIFSLIQLNNTLVNFSNHMGMCERIKSTIFPATYRKFLHGIIYLFVVVLSVSLRDLQLYYELPLLLSISLAFLLLERSATHIQDPISKLPTDTAMTTISRNIEINIKQLLNEPEIPEPIPAAEFYSL
jgi:putative membrane protein